MKGFLLKLVKTKQKWMVWVFPTLSACLVLGTIFRLFLNYKGNKIFIQFPKGFSLYFALINQNLFLALASYLLWWLVTFLHLLPSASETLIQTIICWHCRLLKVAACNTQFQLFLCKWIWQQPMSILPLPN